MPPGPRRAALGRRFRLPVETTSGSSIAVLDAFGASVTESSTNPLSAVGDARLGYVEFQHGIGEAPSARPIAQFRPERPGDRHNGAADQANRRRVRLSKHAIMLRISLCCADLLHKSMMKDGKGQYK